MPIENRNLEVGTRLVADYKKQTYVCSVVIGEGGDGINFVLEDGTRHKSPSAAASRVMSGQAANGWRFWTVEGQAAAKPTKAEKPANREAKLKAKAAPKPKAEKKARAKKFRLFDAIPNAEGDAEGMHRFWCHGCQASFVSESETPETCANGHRADDPELTATPAPEAVEA